MKQTVNERIKILRLETKLTQKKFCQMAGITEVTLWRIESGSETSARTIEQISKVFQVPLDWLEAGKGKLSFVIPDEKKAEDGGWKEVIESKDQIILGLQRQNEFLQSQVNQLMSLLGNAMGGSLGKEVVPNLAIVHSQKEGTDSGTYAPKLARIA